MAFKPVLTLLGAAVGFSLAHPASAHACGPAACGPAAYLPLTGSLPSNAVEFLWRPAWSRSEPTAPQVRLYKLEGSTRTELETQVVDGPFELKRVRPTAPVAAGTELLLESEGPACAIEAPTQARVTVAPASDKPSQLGTLRVVETLPSTIMHIPTAKGSCTGDYRVAAARLALTLDASAQPFSDAMSHGLLIDGSLKRPQPPPTLPPDQWAPPTLTGKLEDVLYTLCDSPSDSWTNDLVAGEHRVQWHATLPDGTELLSDEVTIDLRCEAPADAAAPLSADAPSGAPSGVAPDAGASATSDAANSAADAGAADRSSEQSSITSDADGGASCSLQASGARAGAGWLWLVGMMIPAGLARRRFGARPRATDAP